MNDQVGAARRPGAEPGREVAVDLDDVKLAARREQREGERAAAGSDLHDQIVGLRFDRVDDAPNHGLIVKKVLSESLAGVSLARRRCGLPGNGCGS